MTCFEEAIRAAGVSASRRQMLRTEIEYYRKLISELGDEIIMDRFGQLMPEAPSVVPSAASVEEAKRGKAYEGLYVLLYYD